MIGSPPPQDWAPVCVPRAQLTTKRAHIAHRRRDSVEARVPERRREAAAHLWMSPKEAAQSRGELQGESAGLTKQLHGWGKGLSAGSECEGRGCNEGAGAPSHAIILEPALDSALRLGPRRHVAAGHGARGRGATRVEHGIVVSTPTHLCWGKG
eukprot:7387169-Prymnesium_polylepis.1